MARGQQPLRPTATAAMNTIQTEALRDMGGQLERVGKAGTFAFGCLPGWLGDLEGMQMLGLARGNVEDVKGKSKWTAMKDGTE